MAEGGRGGNPSPVAAALAPGTADSMSESASSQRRASFGRACWCGSSFRWTWAPRLSLARVFGLKWLWSGTGRRGGRVSAPQRRSGGAEKRGGVLNSVGKEQAVRCTYTSLSLCLSLSLCRVSADVVTRAPFLSGATISVLLLVAPLLTGATVTTVTYYHFHTVTTPHPT